MNNADKPIHVKNGENMIHSFSSTDYSQGNFEGLTKREYFAELFLQGILSAQTELRANGNYNHTYNGSIERIVSESLSIADELLKQLETTQD